MLPIADFNRSPSEGKDPKVSGYAGAAGDTEDTGGADGLLL